MNNLKKFFILAASVVTAVVILFTWHHPTKVLPPPTQIESKNFDVRVFFGYKDTRPARFVADRYEAAVFSEILTMSCANGREDCDFKKVDTDHYEGILLTKAINSHNKKQTTVNVRIWTSSVGADDSENRKNPFQKWRSEYVKDQFIHALKKADVIFYNGHSRAGGGPDFSAPLLTSKNHVNYLNYQKNKPGFQLITKTLAQSPS